MPGLFNRILVPIDHTSQSTDSLDLAARLAKRVGASLLLLHAEGRVPPGDESPAVSHTLMSRVNSLREQGLDVQYTVEYDVPEQAIPHIATTEHTDLIVMSPHHWSLLQTLRHASVTASMLANAPVPVLISPTVKPGNRYPPLLTFAGSMVLVPVDGSTFAERAIPYAVRIAKLYDRPLVLARVVAPMPEPGFGLAANRIEAERRLELLRSAQRYVATLRRGLAQRTTVPIQSMLLDGDPAHELLRLAETHDGSLMVMSTHGRTGLNRLLLGSVATAVMREASLPLLVVPPDAQAATELESTLREEEQHVSAV